MRKSLPVREIESKYWESPGFILRKVQGFDIAKRMKGEQDHEEKRIFLHSNYRWMYAGSGRPYN